MDVCDVNYLGTTEEKIDFFFRCGLQVIILVYENKQWLELELERINPSDEAFKSSVKARKKQYIFLTNGF